MNMLKVGYGQSLAAIYIFLSFVFIGTTQAESLPETNKASGNRSVAVEPITVHGASLVGNLEKNSADRSVLVFLPPSYKHDSSRRYPVVYALHGYTSDNEAWSRDSDISQTLEKTFSAGTAEMIVVLPSAQSVHDGSMYSTSITIGDWETFIAEDLVNHIDSEYRTMANRGNRGLAGHSMGGYGTIRIGMKRPDVFSALYIMSPCCLSARQTPPKEILDKLESLETVQESTSLGFLERATLAVAAAWSPNPEKPPFFADLPTGETDEVKAVLARWAANAPLAMADQYTYNLKKYEAIAIDVGNRDNLKHDAAELSRILQTSGVNNQFEIYEGDHGSGVTSRLQHFVIPFFGKHL